MAKTAKQTKSAVHKRLLVIVAFLFVFALGLATGGSIPGAVIHLLVVLAVVIAVLLIESVRLWQAARREALRKPVRVKRLPSQKGVSNG